jgi:hypothetical protein
MPPLIFYQILLDHQSACKEHSNTIIKRLNDKDSPLSTIRNKSTYCRFVLILQLVAVEITYEGVERNLGVKQRRN